MISLSCPLLPEFDDRNWEAIDNTFASVPQAELGQSWLAATEEGFLPATARFGWRDTSLFLYAVLQDRDIFNAADGPNQETWMLGDVLELFLLPPQEETYFELHVTPENQRLQLRLPDAQAAFSERDWREFHVLKPLFSSQTKVDAAQEKWHVLMKVDLNALLGTDFSPSLPWKFSVSRYDWTRGQDEPVISSTSPHQEARFHRQHEWGRLIFTS